MEAAQLVRAREANYPPIGPGEKVNFVIVIGIVFAIFNTIVIVIIIFIDIATIIAIVINQ